MSASTVTCIWCTGDLDLTAAADPDFAPSPGYCSADCESAHGDLLERNWRTEERRTRADYQQHHMLDPDWRLHLTPVGDADRCRHCTGVMLRMGATEFCSAACEDAFYDAYSRWVDMEVRESDTSAPAA